MPPVSARSQERSFLKVAAAATASTSTFAHCKEEAHCGAPHERALTAVQFEKAETAMMFRALAAQEQARRIQSGEIACVANHDVETKSCLPFLIGKEYQTPFLAFGDSLII